MTGIGTGSASHRMDGSGDRATAAPRPLVEAARAALAEHGDLSVRRVAEALRGTGQVHGDGTVLAVHDALVREVRGAGPLEPLLQRPGVTDVLVNGPDAVYVDSGRGLERSTISFAGEEEVRRLAQRLAAGAGRRLDDATPHVDLRLRDGTRFHAVLAPIARGGTSISLRVPRRGAVSLEDLARGGSMDAATVELLRAIVHRRLALLVSGGTGSGKTTLLAALLAEVPPQERLVIIEDSAELDPPHPHVVALEARPANVEGAGEITLRDLVRQSLRMRPDRVVVGEVRGVEVVEMLAALNTGHEGGCGTIHANSAADVVARLEALTLTAGLPREAAHSQLASALHVVVHVERRHDGSRRIAEIGVLDVGADRMVQVVPALVIDAQGRAREGAGAARLMALLAARETGA